MPPPFPLELPERSSKPRHAGLTHVLDTGLPPVDAANVLATCGPYVDIWKLGWGTAYLDPGVEPKLALLDRHQVRGCVGGTLLEVAWAQGRADALLGWAGSAGFSCVEVSRGATPMRPDDKHHLISQVAARGFTVLSEVGTKSPDDVLAPAEWGAEAAADLAAGATWVVAEGRESGTVGLYTHRGEVREDVVAALVAAAGADRLVFEAPRKDQQAWFVRRFGPEVNLANVVPAEVLGLETLRLGLRADTIALSTPSERATVPAATS